MGELQKMRLDQNISELPKLINCSEIVSLSNNTQKIPTSCQNISIFFSFYVKNKQTNKQDIITWYELVIPTHQLPIKSEKTCDIKSTAKKAPEKECLAFST